MTRAEVCFVSNTFRGVLLDHFAEVCSCVYHPQVLLSQHLVDDNHIVLNYDS